MNEHKTAISRTKESRPVRDLLKIGAICGRVLDYGCGKGKDTEFLLKKGFEVLSYDPYYKPIDMRTAGKFDTIICNYVLNVIEDEKARIQLFKTLINHLHNDGKLFITARPVKDITAAAKKGSWIKYKDGFITGKKTFQKGISGEYINELYAMAKTIISSNKLDHYVSNKLDHYVSNAKYSIICIQRAKFYPKL